MEKIRMVSMVFACLLATGFAASSSAAIGESLIPDQQSAVFSGESTTRSSPSVAGPLPDELMLLGAAVIGVIGISIMRKTLH